MAKDDSGTWNDHAKAKTCNTCGGEGEVTTKATDARGKTVETTGTCGACKGTGKP